MGMTVPQLQRRVNELERLVKALMQPKSKAQLIASAASDSKLVYATSGIPARSGTTPGTATCTEYKITSGSYATNTNTLTVSNLSAVAVPSGMVVLASREIITNIWCVEPAIVDLRLSGSTLQYTLDGTNWVTWHTGDTECP